MKRSKRKKVDNIINNIDPDKFYCEKCKRWKSTRDIFENNLCDECYYDDVSNTASKAMADEIDKVIINEFIQKYSR